MADEKRVLIVEDDEDISMVEEVYLICHRTNGQISLPIWIRYLRLK